MYIKEFSRKCITCGKTITARGENMTCLVDEYEQHVLLNHPEVYKKSVELAKEFAERILPRK